MYFYLNWPYSFYSYQLCHLGLAWFGLVWFGLGFFVIAAHKPVFVVTQALPVSYSIISYFPSTDHVTGHGLALLTRHFYPVPHFPFSGEAPFGRVLPHQVSSIPYPEAWLVSAASFDPTPSPQGIEDIPLSSHVWKETQKLCYCQSKSVW